MSPSLLQAVVIGSVYYEHTVSSYIQYRSWDTFVKSTAVSSSGSLETCFNGTSYASDV